MSKARSRPTAPTPSTSIRIRIVSGEHIAMGQGKADLLEAIGRTGSIAAAARDLDMSYRKAWLLVDEVNQCFAAPVVLPSKGGAQGGGAQVTPLGREALARYRAMQVQAACAIAEAAQEFQELLKV